MLPMYIVGQIESTDGSPLLMHPFMTRDDAEAFMQANGGLMFVRATVESAAAPEPVEKTAEAYA
jgi:hypothetical protein